MLRLLSVLLLLLPLRAQAYSAALLGDAGLWTMNTRILFDSLRVSPVRNLILLGDNLYNPSQENTLETVWGPWRKARFNFDAVTIGNHSVGYQSEVDYFQLPGEYYSKVVEKDVRFIVLNSDNVETAQEQAQFFEQELQAATEKFVFVVYHHPSFTLHVMHSWRQKEHFHEAVRPLLKKYRSKITALFVGHEHMASLIHFDDLPVVVSGATQEVAPAFPVSLLPFWNYQDGVKVSTQWFFDFKPYWVRLSTVGQQARLDYVRATDNSIQCTAYIKTGSRARHRCPYF